MTSALTNEKVTVLPTGVTFSPDTTYEEVEQYITEATTLNRFSSWAIGDCLVFGSRKYGEMYAQLEAATGLSYGRLANLKYTCEKVPLPIRVEGLSISHHTEVAKLSPEEQGMWLAMAVEMGWSKAELKAAMNPPAEKTEVMSLRHLAQALVCAWHEGKDLDEWLEKIEVMVSHWPN